MRAVRFSLLSLAFGLLFSFNAQAQDFQGQAFYFSKSTMELGQWGARMSEAQKKQVYERLKNRLNKTYILDFNKEEAVFTEEDQLDAVAGATDSWGSNFSRGYQYKNVKQNQLIQEQEFYGKKFLVKDQLANIEWRMEGETKTIGQYTCFKATASVPTKELTWFNFEWSDLRTSEEVDEAGNLIEPTTEVVAWYTLQVPVSHGPAEYWGLPGLILEVSAGNTTMLCSKVVLNPGEIVKIKAPTKGKETTKDEYQATVRKKMIEMRDNRGRRRG